MSKIICSECGTKMEYDEGEFHGDGYTCYECLEIERRIKNKKWN